MEKGVISKLPMNLKDGIQVIIKGEVFDDEEILSVDSRDASLFEIKPQLVVAPKDSDDIKKLVQFVTHNTTLHLSLTPRSAGTDMSGGAVNDSIILDITKHFNQIIKIEGDRADVQPGVFYRDFEKASLEKGLLLPTYPASRELCTVGGMVANNAAGEKSLAYGQTERYVKSLKAVLSDGNEYIFAPLTKDQLDKKLTQKDFEGEIYRKIYKIVEDKYLLLKGAKPKVSKNTAGYYLWNVWDTQTFDLTKLLVGSQGTLGIITEIEFQLVKPTTHSKLLVIFLKDLQSLGEIVDQVLTHHPESFESYDDYTLKFAARFLPEIIKVFKPKNLISLAWQFLPEVWMSLTGGFPKMVLLAEFTGSSTEEVAKKCLAAQQDLARFKLKTRITDSEDEARKYWVIRRESFSLLRHHAGKLHTAPFIDDIVVPSQTLPEFLPKLQEILSHYKLIYTIAGHIGDGNFHIIPLMDLSKPETKNIITELSEKVYDLVFQYHGSTTAEHNDGMIRGPYLKKMYGEKVYKLFKEVKQIFDPKDIFNPHKKVDANFDFALSHLAQEHKVKLAS